MVTIRRHPTSWIVLFSFLLALPLVAATLHQGKWTKKGYSIAGTWQIVEEGGRKFVVLDDAFKTKNAPDLKIFLSPRSVAELNNRNATQGSVLVGPLQSPKGAQRLEIPSGTNLSSHRSILIHCEKYSKLWGAAAL